MRAKPVASSRSLSSLVLPPSAFKAKRLRTPGDPVESAGAKATSAPTGEDLGWISRRSCNGLACLAVWF